MSEPFIGAIILFGGNFAPRGWAFCTGSLLSIAQNTALFSILGTTYGGNGQTTFGLPDLRGRVPIGFDGNSGPGPGLSSYTLGEQGGSESQTLTTGQLPAHNHQVPAAGLLATAKVKDADGNARSPVGNVWAREAAGVTATYSSVGPDASMATGAITLAGSATSALTGSSQPHSLIQPYTGMNYIIALEGIFPSRN